jgi:hypothetical protein
MRRGGLDQRKKCKVNGDENIRARDCCGVEFRVIKIEGNVVSDTSAGTSGVAYRCDHLRHAAGVGSNNNIGVDGGGGEGRRRGWILNGSHDSSLQTGSKIGRNGTPEISKRQPGLKKSLPPEFRIPTP